VLVGFHERRSSYVADMTSCEVLPPHVSRLLPELRVLVQATSIANRLPQIEVSVGARATVLVFRILQPLTPADEALLRRFAEQHGVQVWLQTAGPESAQPFHPLDGPALDYVLDDFGVRIAFLPTDFTQVNHAINAVLVRRALRLLAPQRGERVLDLFCGLGNFALPAAALGARVTGYEGNAGLARRAQENAARNGLAAEFGVANLFEPTQVPSLSTAHKLIIDPPREGAVEVVKAVDPQAAPERIVYVSCDPATLARDAGILVSQKGYRLAAAGIANMFPHTAHVESIALFTRE
jgi:23S rRNA (uracil1939-C5)-methyltransferase